MKKLLFVSLVLLSTKSFSQTTDAREVFKRNSFWTETVFIGVIKNKWRFQLDYQYRRTSDASDAVGGSGNMFKNDFQHVYRPWIHYQMNENVRFSLSPLGFWQTFTPRNEPGTATGSAAKGYQQIQPEFRICPQITLTNKIGRLIIDQRYRMEFRLLGNKVKDTASSEFSGYNQGFDFPDANHKMRMRYFLRATLPLNNPTLVDNTFYITCWNEIFIATGKNTPNDKIWDQNRSFFMLGFKPKMELPMRFELGYSMIYANRFSQTMSGNNLLENGNKIEKNNIFQVYIIFENFNKLFKRNKPAAEPMK